MRLIFANCWQIFLFLTYFSISFLKKPIQTNICRSNPFGRAGPRGATKTRYRATCIGVTRCATLACFVALESRGVGTNSRTRTPNPNYSNLIPNCPNPNYPITISDRKLKNPNLIRVIRVLTPATRITRTLLKPNKL